MEVLSAAGARAAARLTSAALGMLWPLAPSVAIPLAPAIVLLWRGAGTRGEAALRVALYYFCACLPIVASASLPDHPAGELVAYAILAAAVVSTVWTACWHSCCAATSVRGVARTSLALALTTLPPVGVLGVASPLTAAGLWFPHAGLVGLALHALVLGLLPLRGCTRMAAGAHLAYALVPLLIFAAPRTPRTHPWSALVGIDTELELPRSPHDFGTQYRAMRNAQDELAAAADAAPRATLFVLGENVAGLWTRAARRGWAANLADIAARDQTLVLGATRPVADRGDVFEAAAVVVDGASERIVRQRVPLPFVMWRPWSESPTYRAAWLAPGVVQVRGTAISVLLCYEQLLVFPVLHAAVRGASVLVGISNLRDIGSVQVLGWQRAALDAWAALFGVSAVHAANQ